MEDKLLEFAAKALNMEQEQIKETLEQDGGLDTLLQADAQRVKTVKDTGYKAGERKVNTAWESKLQAAFNIQSDTKGPELIDHLAEVIETKQATAPEKELTEAQLKKLPYVMQLEKRAQEAETTTEEKWKKVLAEKEEAWQQKEVFSEVKSKGLGIFEGLKPILSDDPAKARNQKEIIARELANYKYMKNGDEIILLDSETGERLNNAQGYPIKFEDVVKDITTSYFDLQVSEPRSSSGRAPEESNVPNATAIPKTKEEYAKFLSDDSIEPAEKAKVIEAFRAQ